MEDVVGFFQLELHRIRISAASLENGATARTALFPPLRHLASVDEIDKYLKLDAHFDQ